jgi:hypothetical protein
MMDYKIETDTGAHVLNFEADKKAVDHAREVALKQGIPCVVWRKVAMVTPVTTTEVVMHMGEGK